MRRVSVTWEKVVEVTLYVPSDMDDKSIRGIAQATADDIDRYGWEADWDTVLGRVEDVDVPDEECRVTTKQNRYGGTYEVAVEGSRLRRADVMVMGDDRDEVVNPPDATWWLVPAQEET
jgi:hypothetical protein